MGDQIDGLIQLMVYVGSRLLGDASLYNSAKHGLSSIANAEMKVRLKQGHNTDFIDGPVLAHLRTVPNRRIRRRNTMSEPCDNQRGP